MKNLGKICIKYKENCLFSICFLYIAFGWQQHPFILSAAGIRRLSIMLCQKFQLAFNITSSILSIARHLVCSDLDGNRNEKSMSLYPDVDCSVVLFCQLNRFLFSFSLFCALNPSRNICIQHIGFRLPTRSMRYALQS